MFRCSDFLERITNQNELKPETFKWEQKRESWKHLIQNCQMCQEFYNSERKLPPVGLDLIITASFKSLMIIQLS